MNLLGWQNFQGQLANAQNWSQTPDSTMKTVANQGPANQEAVQAGQISQAFASAQDQFNAGQKAATQNQIAGLGNLGGGFTGGGGLA
jgi:ABC-type nitrate/sulfonate/bicarbonate transport system substrate-binding protein